MSSSSIPASVIRDMMMSVLNNPKKIWTKYKLLTGLKKWLRKFRSRMEKYAMENALLERLKCHLLCQTFFLQWFLKITRLIKWPLFISVDGVSKFVNTYFRFKIDVYLCVCVNINVHRPIASSHLPTVKLPRLILKSSSESFNNKGM